jgi:hypothetical protein
VAVIHRRKENVARKAEGEKRRKEGSLAELDGESRVRGRKKRGVKEGTSQFMTVGDDLYRRPIETHILSHL